MSQSLQGAFTFVSLWSPASPPGSRQGGGCYSHHTDEESKLRTNNFSHVGFKILKVSDSVQENWWWLGGQHPRWLWVPWGSFPPISCPLSFHSTLSGRNVFWTLSFGILHFFLIHTRPGISRTWFFLEGLPVRMVFCLDFSLPEGVGGGLGSSRSRAALLSSHGLCGSTDGAQGEVPSLEERQEEEGCLLEDCGHYAEVWFLLTWNTDSGSFLSRLYWAGSTVVVGSLRSRCLYTAIPQRPGALRVCVCECTKGAWQGLDVASVTGKIGMGEIPRCSFSIRSFLREKMRPVYGHVPSPTSGT